MSSDPASLPPAMLAELEKIIITDFFSGGPKDGHNPRFQVTDEIDKIQFNTWSSRRCGYYRGNNVSNHLSWDLTVQSTWATSVLRRGIAVVDGHPILFARRLHTTRFETYEVVALKRGPGFTATAIKGFVFRLPVPMPCVFDSDRKRGQKRFKRKVREQTLAVFNDDILT